MTLALGSANRAAKVLTRQLRGEAVDWQTEYADYVMQGINTFRAYVSAWYDGTLHDIFFAAAIEPEHHAANLLSAGGLRVGHGPIPYVVAAGTGVAPVVENRPKQGRARFDPIRLRRRESVEANPAGTLPR